MPEGFHFDEATHAYSLDGRTIPSVTQILQAVGIVDYSHIPPSTRNWALERGRMVHLYTQYDDQAVLDDSLIDPHIAPYLAAWRKFRRETGFVHDLIEHRSHHALHGYAGTLDRRGALPKKGRTLLDIKTNTAEEWVRLQIAAYAALFDDPATYTRMCVELHADETYRLIIFPAREFRQDFQDFLGALSTMRWLQTMKRIPSTERTVAA
jgi:hypothetical protein